jgi:uncharacterized protein (DUF427 family)
MKAIWNGAVVAESGETVVVEGNHYFPSAALDRARIRPSATRTTCSWKGVAHYYDLEVDGKINADAVWYYPEPKLAANTVKDRVAFWKGVSIVP